MTTRKEVIIQNYLEFQKQLQKKNFDCSIFPSLEDVDLVDLLVLFILKFGFLDAMKVILNCLYFLPTSLCQIHHVQ